MNVEKTNEEKILTANQMIGELLLGIVLYGVTFYIIYGIIYIKLVHLLEQDKNFMLLGTIVLVLQIIMIFLTLNLANKKAFKKGTIFRADSKKVITNIAFVIIIILVFQILGTFENVNSSIDKAVADNIELQYKEHLLSIIYDDEQMAIYEQKKKKIIQEIKKELYQYLAIIEIGTIIIYGSAIYLEKKYIYNKAK